jgi:NAD(P)-dependent dehydrogenase (short-subunit alcohol dehydrogenase family)
VLLDCKTSFQGLLSSHRILLLLANRSILLYDRLVHFARCDVTQWEDQAALFKLAVEKSKSGNIDLVVANAGISGQDPVFLNPGKS